MKHSLIGIIACSGLVCACSHNGPTGVEQFGQIHAKAPSIEEKDTSSDCTGPVFYLQEPGDNTDDAAGAGQLFERIEVPGITDRLERTAASAWWDMNGDNLPDLLTNNNDIGVNLFVNEGCFKFRSVPVVIHRDNGAEGDIGRGGSTMASADFNDDGLPDIVIGTSGTNRMEFLVSREFGDNGLVLDDLAVSLGVTNNGAYVHGQISIGDVNNDGWLDIAVGAEQIGADTKLGRPLSRMYVFQPSGSGKFEDGKFVDIGGTEKMPDFGGVTYSRCDPKKDKAISSLLLRDLDDDGDLDMIASAQSDINPGRTPSGSDPCSPGLWETGLLVYRNLLVENGELAFEKLLPGSGSGLNDQDAVLPESGKMTYDPETKKYVPVNSAITSYVAHTADFDNDNDLDVISIAPTNPSIFAANAPMAGKYWVNEGGWSFLARTEEAGLAPMSWNYAQWAEFFVARLNPSKATRLFCSTSPNRGNCEGVDAKDLMFWTADLVSGDWDNDGWRDFILLDRHELDNNWDFLRDVFFRNDGTGVFEPMATTWSGLSENMISGEVMDIDGDGWLDFYEAARNSGSGQVARLGLTEGERADQNSDRIYWNNSAAMGSAFGWLRIELAGYPQRQLIGSKVLISDPETNRFLARQDYFTVTSYKSSHEPFAHFGLGVRKVVDAEVVLPSGERVCFPEVLANQFITMDVAKGARCQ